jgi:hypothetical protein
MVVSWNVGTGAPREELDVVGDAIVSGNVGIFAGGLSLLFSKLKVDCDDDTPAFIYIVVRASFAGFDPAKLARMLPSITRVYASCVRAFWSLYR